MLRFACFLCIVSPMSAHTREARTLPLTLGQQFQAARKRTGLDQDQLAEVLGVTRTTISRWETDRNVPPFTAVSRLSEMSGWDLELFARAATPSEPDFDPAAGGNATDGQVIDATGWFLGIADEGPHQLLVLAETG